ncbi:hypothetical protein MSAN_02303200 [Mycena sanguinolenta]|uniref:Uncharacterized protein n=1 Tax=Mycena sanguinolenta TaxID=230812 RepID=A0A8H6X9K0_9AGAR|nr:hypothetical protein MSAN_02303200 [Mycena sanguinolenta]
MRSVGRRPAEPVPRAAGYCFGDGELFAPSGRRNSMRGGFIRGHASYIKLRRTHFYLPPCPPPPQKPLLLPGIAPHLFQSRRAHKTVKTSSSIVTYRYSPTMLESSSPDQNASSHNKQGSDASMESDYVARRTAEALVKTQAAELALLRANVSSLTSHAHTTTTLYQETQRQLMRATIHLNTILTLYAETGTERGLEAAIIAARDFVQDLMHGSQG